MSSISKASTVFDKEAIEQGVSVPIKEGDVQGRQTKDRQQCVIDSARPTCDPSVRPPHTVFDVIVNINVCRDGVVIPYSIHQGLLRFYSSFFRSKLKVLWMASDTSITLEDCDEETMDCFNSWLYTGTLFLNDRALSQTRRDISLLIKTWVFADQYGVPALQNACVDDIQWQFKHHGHTSPFEHLSYLDQHTAKGSKLRSLFLDLAASGRRSFVPPKIPQLDCALYLELLQILLANNQDPQAPDRLRKRLDNGESYRTQHPEPKIFRAYIPAEPIKFVLKERGSSDSEVLTLYPGRSAEEHRLDDYNHGFRFPAHSTAYPSKSVGHGRT